MIMQARTSSSSLFSGLGRLSLASVLLASFAIPAHAGTYDLVDTYIGKKDNGYGDVIGDAGLFDIFGLDASLSGSVLNVDIYSNFAGRGDDGLYSGYTYDGKGIGYGDLLLSSDYSSPTDPHYGWEYGFSLDNRYASNGGTGTLYSLDPSQGVAADKTSTSDPFLLSDNFMKSAIYRNGQVVAVDTGATNAVSALSGGSWSVDASEKRVSFSMDLAGTQILSALQGGEEVALHWGMTCQNDVIEGEVAVSPVPVPAALWLFGSAMLGFLGVSRRKKATTVA
jgi:hypothetical protein